MDNYYIDILSALKIAAKKSKDYTDLMISSSSVSEEQVNRILESYLKQNLGIVVQDGVVCAEYEEGE